MSANDKTSVGSGSGEWETPPELFRRLQVRYRFTYDAFATHENALTGLYSTIEGTFHKDKRQGPRDVLSLDGLGMPWEGKRVFLNPPYTRGLMAQAMRKCAIERNYAAIIVALIPDARDTKWWQDYVARYADDYPIGRVPFIHPPFPCTSKRCAEHHKQGEPIPDPPGNSVVVVFRPDWMRRS